MTGLVTLGETMGVLSTMSRAPLALHQQLSLSIAGAESTVAIGVARLGHPSRWIGRVGDDEIGRIIAKTLTAEGIDVSSVAFDVAAPTGLMVKERCVGDVVRVSYHRRGSAGSLLSVTDLPEAAIAAAGVLHVTGITAALSESAAAAVRRAVAVAREAGVPVSFDVNYRAGLWPRERAAEALTPLAMSADIVFGSEDELALVTGNTRDIAKSAAILLAGGPRTVLAKLGADGAAAYDASGCTTAGALAVPVVDVVGAGDAFVAGYLSGLLSGADPAGRPQLGCRLGAFCVGTAGDWEGIPRVGELGLLGATEPTVLGAHR